MAEDRLNQKKKTALFMGVLLALLTLLGFSVTFFNHVTRVHIQVQSTNAGSAEIFVILIGMTLVGTVGVYLLTTLWKGQPKSLAYHIGIRVVASGYLVVLTSALADYLGIGAHHKLPYFGPLQNAGILVGEAVLVIGFFLMLPWSKNEK